MADESLKDIGINLSNEFQALLCNYTSGWLSDNLLNSEDWKEIALLYEETERFDEVINEAKVWEKLLTTGFIPPDLGTPNNINLGEETTSDDRPKIHPYLETWKRYESLVNPDRQISTANGQSSYIQRRSPPDSPSLSIADTSSTPKVTSQRVVTPEEKPKKYPVIEKFLENVAEVSPSDTITTSRDLGFDKSDSKGGDRVLSQELGLSKSDSGQNVEVLAVDEPTKIKTQFTNNVNLPNLNNAIEDEPTKIKTQFANNVNLPNLNNATQKISHSQRDFAQNSLGMKGLKDLSAFLASQPNKEHIIEADLLRNDSSENILFAESELTDSQMETSKNRVTYFSGFDEEVQANGGLVDSKESEVENRTKIDDDSRYMYAMVEPALHSDRNSELEMDIILEAIAKEINREYSRFYGE
ncbi:hypothetical protein [Microcoleus sp. herbarium14]|uniref:hypothetical protein n=1 Tax=Microcoleus sp. herbarium14 TaxID=3055439 RepID=UPI002FD63869